MRAERARAGAAAGAVRAFVALPVDEECRRRLARFVDELRPRLSGVRWASPEALHLTLRFLGPATPEALRRLAPALAAAAARCPPSRVPLLGAGVFPERGAPRVLWAGLAFTPALSALQQACEDAAVAGGFAREGRPFRPHLTLGRFREGRRAPALPPLVPGEATLDRLVLFRSDLHAGGAVHTPLETWPLALPAPGP